MQSVNRSSRQVLLLESRCSYNCTLGKKKKQINLHPWTEGANMSATVNRSGRQVCNREQKQQTSEQPWTEVADKCATVNRSSRQVFKREQKLQTNFTTREQKQQTIVSFLNTRAVKLVTVNRSMQTRLQPWTEETADKFRTKWTEGADKFAIVQQQH